MVLEPATSPYTHLNVEKFATPRQAMTRYMSLDLLPPIFPPSQCCCIFSRGSLRRVFLQHCVGRRGAAHVIVSEEFPSPPNNSTLCVRGCEGGEAVGCSWDLQHRVSIDTQFFFLQVVVYDVYVIILMNRRFVGGWICFWKCCAKFQVSCKTYF